MSTLTGKRSRFVLVVAAVFAVSLGYRSSNLGSSRSPGASRAKSALILYDAPQADPKLGITYAKMIQALLGHFDMNSEIQPVGNYLAGQMASYSAIFYLGSYYNNPLPDDFLRDAAKTDNRVVWFKYNLWQLTGPDELKFGARTGIRFLDLHGLDSEPSAQNPKPGFYDTVLYKGKELKKYYEYDPGTQEVAADPELGLIRLDDPRKAQVRVKIRNSRTGDEAPYIVQAGPKGNFWYFADLPLSYIGPRDRYLVLCDILHDILGVNHPESHKALVRLEDVSAKVEFSSIKKISDYLYSQKIPFSVAVIPAYRDPLGFETNGQPESISFEQAAELQRSLKYAMQEGGSIVMHGYTHQYGSQKNPHSGVSADDFEFWDTVANAPVPEDGESWAAKRLGAGLSELANRGIAPWAWETPHYQASPLSYLAMSKRFSTTYQRMVYYSSSKPDLHAPAPKRDYAAGVFFPYVINRDPYGHRIVPENLGNIEYDISSIDPSSNITYTWKDIVVNAEHALIVRDGFASFFFHPFWLDPGFEKLNAYDDFKQTVEGISRLGYEWMDARKLAPTPNASETNTALSHD